MPWFLIALGSAISSSLKDLVSKQTLPRLDEYIVVWALRFYSLPVLAPLLFFIPWPTTGWFYWSVLTVTVFLKTFIIILYMRAIKLSDLSLVAPLVTSTPLFLLITSPIMVNEFPQPIGLVGVVFIVIGAYMLNVRLRRESVIRPLKALWRDKGARLMLIVAFLWSITSNIDKIGIQASSAMYWSVTTNIGCTIVMFPIMYWKAKQPLNINLLTNRSLFLIGFFTAFSNLFHMIALKFALVAYVISVKRLSAVFNVCYGYFIFGERQFTARLVGSVIMIIGAILLTF